MAVNAPTDVTIIGGGFAGSVLAAEVLRRDPAATLALIDPAEPGPGNAYATTDAVHLMNGPVRAMSAVPDRAGDLGRWLGEHVDPDALIPRAQFGRYLAERAREALAQAPGARLIRGTALDVEPLERGYRVHLAAGEPIVATSLVLALGNAPAGTSFGGPGLTEDARFIGDAWRFDGAGISGEVLCIGSGLTALDALAALDARGFRGRVTMVSRHALTPLLEDASVRAADPDTLDLDRSTPVTLLHSLRRAARAGAARGLDWRAVAESIRREIPVIWAGWDPVQRRRFLRHLQPYWSVHRYRVPIATAAARDALAARGALEIVRGRVRSVDRDGDRLRAQVRTPSGERTILADWVVNCSGPESDLLRVERPLERALVRRGLIRPDALRLGWDISEDLTPLGAHGRPWPGLYAIGPATRSRFYESTGVPEIRAQAARVAAMLARRG
jgi:uncharacterized NAD(P)/FAD-binding protein YdhS